MLQGHTDMVCEQNEGTGHDFETEGLELYVEKGWLKARGTTLGGDDGVAVAIMMAILADDTLPHPEVECLFTTGEETGLYGATGFDYSVVRAKKLINLDSEEEGVATVSCAGGIGLDFRIRADRLPIAKIARPISVEISGLAGGHSGADIHLEHGNADILLTRILSALYEKHPFNLITIHGGTRGNAIPREASAVLMTAEPEEAIDFIKAYTETVKTWLPKADKRFRVKVGKAKGRFDTMLSFADTNRLLTLTALMPNGVIAHMTDMLEMVQTSNNLGVIRDEGEDGILLIYHGRSSMDSRMDEMEYVARRLAAVLNLELDVNGRYSGWPMKAESRLAEDFMTVAKEVLGDTGRPCICAIHAGLECGIICSAVEGLDAISIGPELKGIHAPGEALELGSMERLYQIVCELLKR
jgi:dipeptidase D